MTTRKIFRSVLFTPADKIRAHRTLVNSQADCIVLDLEDSVSSYRKSEARLILSDFLTSWAKPQHQHVIVRINCPFSTDWGYQDIDALAPLDIDALLLPKVQSGSAINSLNLTHPTNIPLWAMIETAKGVINAEEIASITEIQALVFGSNDLTKDLRARQTVNREPLLYSMGKVILAARSAGKYVIDGVHMNPSDLEGLEVACKQGRELGFDGKSLIHPSQVEIANKHFMPTIDEYTKAMRIVAAFSGVEERSRAGQSGAGVCVADGQLIERLHVQEAKESIQVFEALQDRSRSSE